MIIRGEKQLKETQPWMQNERGVCHTVALPLTLKNIARQKKNYGNSKNLP
jgi:hypothetical protein